MLRIPGAISPAKPLVAAIAISCISAAQADGIEISIVTPSCASYLVDSVPATDTEATTTFDEAIALFSSECNSPNDSATITIADSLAGQILTTAPGVNIDNSRQLSITGNAANPPILKAEDVDNPAFSLSESSRAVLTNLKLVGTGTSQPPVESSAIRVNNSTLELSNVTASDFYVSSAGAAVDASLSTVTITDSLFENNATSNGKGGAINTLDSALTITDSVFDNNQAKDQTTSSGGGAIATEGQENALSALTISGSQFIGNQSRNHGGALLLDSIQPISITDSLFDSNSASGSFFSESYFPAYGGAISMERVSATLSGNMFKDNQASAQGADGDALGGAIHIGETNLPRTPTGGVIEITDTTFQGNVVDSESATGNGGALFLELYSNANVTVSGSTFSQNAASSNGGAIVAKGNRPGLAVINSTFTANSAAQTGGAIMLQSIDADSVSISHATFVANTLDVGEAATGAAGLHMINTSGNDVVIHHTVFSGNHGTQGALCSQGNEAEYSLTNSFVDINTDHAGCDFIRNLDTGNNQIGSAEEPLDAGLQDIGLYGGNTFTFMPSASSPLVDAGDANIEGAPETDQRGKTRIYNGVIDIGAVERGSDNSAVVTVPGTGSSGGGASWIWLGLLGLLGLRQKR